MNIPKNRTATMLHLLLEKYPLPQYATFPELASGTGLSAQTRADLVVMGIWPSRGLELQGFEIKNSRQDWLNELKNPSKAEEIARYCHYWWLVVADLKIIRDDEIPANWGVITLSDSGKLYTYAAAGSTRARADHV